MWLIKHYTNWHLEANGHLVHVIHFLHITKTTDNYGKCFNLCTKISWK